MRGIAVMQMLITPVTYSRMSVYQRCVEAHKALVPSPVNQKSSGTEMGLILLP